LAKMVNCADLCPAKYAGMFMLNSLCSLKLNSVA
jgi:hypothetical protein